MSKLNAILAYLYMRKAYWKHGRGKMEIKVYFLWPQTYFPMGAKNERVPLAPGSASPGFGPGQPTGNPRAAMGPSNVMSRTDIDTSTLNNYLLISPSVRYGYVAHYIILYGPFFWSIFPRTLNNKCHYLCKLLIWLSKRGLLVCHNIQDPLPEELYQGE